MADQVWRRGYGLNFDSLEKTGIEQDRASCLSSTPRRLNEICISMTGAYNVFKCKRIFHECARIIEFIKRVEEKDKMLGLASILSLFRNEFIKFINT